LFCRFALSVVSRCTVLVKRFAASVVLESTMLEASATLLCVERQVLMLISPVSKTFLVPA
jgi:hypothetical protein